jgi:hypothetical protein
MSRREIIDRYLGKGISKKLMVFIIASVALFVGKVTSNDWVIVASIYIGSQTVIDVLKAKSGSINDTSGGTY